jgi:hypothetical protein
MGSEKLLTAYQLIDAYNSNDPHSEEYNGELLPKELLYGTRMTDRLLKYAPEAPEYLKLASRAQHIGRWEIPRSDYPMDRKGYLQWRSAEKFHHARIIEPILKEAGYDHDTIEKVKFLLLKKELATNPDTQTLEDIICLVFIEHYLEEFASHHDDDKVTDILRKTMKKMSPRCIAECSHLKVSERIQGLLLKAGDDS